MKNEKKKTKKEVGELPKTFEALAGLTSSDIVQQLKIGLSRLGPLEGEEQFNDPRF